MRKDFVGIRAGGSGMLLLGMLGLIGGLMAQGRAQESGFGVREKSETALIGILYDFKQTQKRVKTSVDTRSYAQIVDNFLSKGWDEGVLNGYYRVTQPLYTTQVYIPLISASAAPKAFGAEKTVEPRLWMVHYKGQISAPQNGRYRFVGYADDWIAVAINQETVLLNHRHDTPLPKTAWKSKEKEGMQASNGRLRYGDWVEFKEGVVMDLDVAMGERPGGFFSAFLLIQKEGETYEKSSKGDSILPLFQLVPRETQPAKELSKGPPFVLSPRTWKSVQ
ncbi:MAG: hypothetical protein HC904_06700 [Blastochloris sp.]|nr:hypothetical protein [Blastochloris sp.]